MEEKVCEFFVAGVQFHQLKTVIKGIQPGDILTLRAEPTNKYDPNAVRIELGDVMLGYVPAKQGNLSAKVSGLLQIERLLCRVLEVNPDAKTWEQLKVEIVSMVDEAITYENGDVPVECEDGSN
jgi:hypothetical protein